MNPLPLHKRGLQASRLVLGCMSFGGGWDRNPVGPEELRAGEAALDAALASGITMFDHADIYTMGKAEQTFGALMRERPGLRGALTLQSKCGIRFADDAGPGRFDFSKAHILAAVDGILQRLATEYLDILLLHRPDPLMEPDEVAEAFGLLKSAGKVRYFGVSNMSASQIRFLQEVLPDRIVANQLEMSLGHLDFLDQGIHVNQRAGVGVNFAEGLMEYCRMEGIQIQAWGPLARGLFSGRPIDHEPEPVRDTAILVRRMAAEKETSSEAIVLAWLMRHPAMIQPVIGTINPQRIAACADAERQAEVMTREEWYALYVSARGAAMP